MSAGGAHSFVIAGGGLAGALMAVYLGRAGHPVTLLEMRPDPRTARQVRGRSINLALSTRGLEALREVDLADEIMKTAVPMRGRMMHAPDGRLAYQPYGTEKTQAINSVSRAGLNLALLDAAERHPNVRTEFDVTCHGVDLDTGAVEIVDGLGERRRVTGEVVIGADGVNSRVRGAMQRLARFDYSQEFLAHGYKELTIPAGPGGSFRMERNALHIWPRRSYMMIALPNADGSYTVTLFWPFDGPESFASLRTESDVLTYFRAHFPDAVPLMPDLASDYLASQPGAMVTIRCGPWYHGDRVVLVGDAAHGVVPFYGQGMNAAFESCSVLNRCLELHPGDRRRAFEEYYRRRKANTDALARLAVDNFLEMRDRVGSPAFLRRKRMEKVLHRLLPFWYLPLYSMVSFSLIPYAGAVERARRQDEVIRKVGVAVAVIVTVGLIGLAWIVFQSRS